MRIDRKIQPNKKEKRSFPYNVSHIVRNNGNVEGERSYLHTLYNRFLLLLDATFGN